jgi:hypothetical protein
MNEKNFYVSHQAMAQHSMPHDKRQFEKQQIRRNTILPPMKVLFRIFGKPHFPRGELVAVTGKAKCSKTLFNAILLVCWFLDEVLQVQHLRELKAAVKRFRPVLPVPYGVRAAVLLRFADLDTVVAQLRLTDMEQRVPGDEGLGACSDRSPPS